MPRNFLWKCFKRPFCYLSALRKQWVCCCAINPNPTANLKTSSLSQDPCHHWFSRPTRPSSTSQEANSTLDIKTKHAVEWYITWRLFVQWVVIGTSRIERWSTLNKTIEDTKVIKHVHSSKCRVIFNTSLFSPVRRNKKRRSNSGSVTVASQLWLRTGTCRAEHLIPLRYLYCYLCYFAVRTPVAPSVPCAGMTPCLETYPSRTCNYIVMRVRGSFSLLSVNFHPSHSGG